MGKRPILTLYGRDGCHLCDEALRELRSLAALFECDVETVDIESDDELLRRYMFEIPVVAVGDVEIAKAPIRPGVLEDALRGHLCHQP